MNRRNILLVSSAFYPEISPRSFRATELAKEFYRQGHYVTVISKYRDYNYTEFLQEFGIRFKMWKKSRFPAIPQSKLFPLSIISKVISRLFELLFEYPAIEEMFRVRDMLKAENGFDILISFAIPYPVHWGVALAIKRKNLISRIWVADCGDPYMFARLDTFKKPFYFKLLEVNFCKKCNYISIPIEAMQSQFYPEFAMKIRIIPQGINLKEIKLFKGEICNQKPVFIFAGSIIPGKRDLNMFLKFLITLDRDFLFIVYTNQNSWYAKYKDILGDKLVIRSYIERMELIYEMSKADFLVNVDTIFEKDSSIVAVPSKLIDYAIAGRPILNIISDALDREIVLEFLDKNYSRQRMIDKSKYDIRKITARFLSLIN